MSLEDCRSRLPGVSLWQALGLDGWDKVQHVRTGKEAKICSPFRPDKSPSFSVFLGTDGTLCAKDHGTGQGFDDVQLIEAARQASNKDAIRLYHEMSGAPFGKDDPHWAGSVPLKKSAPVKPKLEAPVPEIKQTYQGPREVKAKPVKVDDGRKPQRRLVAEYDYRAETGKVLHQTLRFEPKEFRQRRKPVATDDPEKIRDGWVWSLKGGDLVPYRLPELLSEPGATILLVEGEKDADALAELLTGKGVVVTSLPMGSGKWREEFGQWFHGRRVCVLADFDEPREDGSAAGYDGAVKVCRELLAVAGRVSLMELPELWKAAPYGTDGSDWLATRLADGAEYDDLADELVLAVQNSRLPLGMVYDGVIEAGRSALMLNEDLLARRLVMDEGLIFCAESFWRYDGRGIWQREINTLKIEQKVREVMRKMGGHLLITAAKVKSVVQLAKSVRAVGVERLNSAPAGVLCLENGMLNTKSGQLEPFRADYLMTNRMPHAWNPAALCPTWTAWLEERHPDQETRDCLQEMFGYCMATDINFHVFFFLYGDGGTGKSTCVTVLEDLIGEANRVSIQLEELDNAFMRSQLVGKSLYLCKELTTKSFAHIGLIKAIVSGDPIPVDMKYKQPFDFRPFGRMVMESNVIAMTPDSSGGFTRRFVQIDWERPVARENMDFSLNDKFRAEMPGILVWAMQGAMRLRARGHFHLTAKSEQSREQLMRHRAQVASMLEDGTLYDTGDNERHKISTQKMFDVYSDWCEENDVVPFYRERNAFLRELMSKRPDWRERKVRLRSESDGQRHYYIKGVSYVDKTESE